MELTNILSKILPTLIVGVYNNLFDKSIEKLVMDKADFESIIKDRILLEELPAINTRLIRQFLKSDDVELIVKQIYVDDVDKTREEIKEDFCLLFSRYFDVNTEQSYEFASNLFDVLVEGCQIILDKFISKGNLAAHDAKSQNRFRKLSDDLGRIDRNTQDTADIVSQFKNAIPLLAPEHPIQKIYLGRLPSPSSVFFGREQELEDMDAAWTDPNTNIISLVAWGGVGKTSLVNEWLRNMKADSYRGAERIFGWSFYSQGASEDKQVSADVFFASALKWFGYPKPDEGSPWDKSERLAELIKKQKTLLILDGLEPLQHPPREGGKIKDPALQYLLKELAYKNRGLCVITTRLDVDDIKDFGNSVQNISLKHLSPDAGMELLKHLGVKGTPDELKQASHEFGHHALALTLLGSYLSVVYGGDVRERDRIARLTDDEEHGGHAKRVMESYEKWFKDTPELNVLYILGVFGGPAEDDAIKALRTNPVINGLTSDFRKLSSKNWLFALNRLRKVGLLAKENDGIDKLDCHPLMREYFGEKLKKNNPKAWEEAHSRLYDYYKDSAKKLPDTIEDMSFLYQAVAHGCKAGRSQEAFEEVYWPRILRCEKYFSVNKLGSFSGDLVALHGFFDTRWNQPITEITDSNKSLILNLVGFCLRSLGRLEDAAKPFHAAMDILITLEEWENAAKAAHNLSQLYLNMGNLTSAWDYSKKSSGLANQSDDAFTRIISKTSKANILHQAGKLVKAEAAFIEAEKMQKEWKQEYSYLISLSGFFYCDLLMSQEKYSEVLNRAGQTLEWMIKEDAPLLTEGLDHISLGRGHMLQIQLEGGDNYAQAETHLNQALGRLRQQDAQEFITGGLLALAELYRVRRDFPKAQRDLAEAMTIAERGSMGLHKADCHLEYARLYLAMDKKEDARKNIETAKEMIEDMGYHRRDDEVKEIEEQL